jgi:hypothetical protein
LTDLTTWRGAPPDVLPGLNQVRLLLADHCPSRQRSHNGTRANELSCFCQTRLSARRCRRWSEPLLAIYAVDCDLIFELCCKSNDKSMLRLYHTAFPGRLAKIAYSGLGPLPFQCHKQISRILRSMIDDICVSTTFTRVEHAGKRTSSITRCSPYMFLGPR